MAVQSFKVIRDKLGWTKYKMAKELGISQSQYAYLEDTAMSTQTHILLKLFDISGMSEADFWRLFTRIERKAQKSADN